MLALGLQTIILVSIFARFVFNLSCLDMLFDEDAILLSFFNRYEDPEDEEDLKKEVIKYCKGGNIGGNV